MRLRVFALAVTACALVAQGAGARILPRVESRIAALEVPREAGLPSDAQLEALGARIGEIRFNARDLFDTSATDEDTALTRLANRLHSQTRTTTIRNQLLFKPGDPYQARLLEESARILRNANYLRHAQIRPVSFHDGVVDVEVITQDVWTFNPGIAYGRSGGEDTSGFEIEELNLLGTGTQLSLGVKSGVDRSSRSILFRDRQLGASWWDLSVNYADNSDGRRGSLALDHPFHALDARWAGGLALLDDRRIDARYDRAEIIDRFETRERRSTLYLGHSAGLIDRWARRVTFGFTDERHGFSAAPGGETPRLLPADRVLAYPWIGAQWVEEDFQTTRNHDQIEKIEDLSLGWNLSARIGYADKSFGADRGAVMLAGGAAKGLPLASGRTLLLSTAWEGRIEGGSAAGMTLEANARYYHRQSDRRLLFLGLSTLVRMHPDADQQVLLGGDNGLRGYPLRYRAGEGRWLVTAEQRFFSTWYPFQLFNVGGAVFCDVGGVWGRDPLAVTPARGVYRDVGFGLRLGNSRSALGNVLHVDVAFPLDGEASIRSVQFLVETRRSY